MCFNETITGLPTRWAGYNQRLVGMENWPNAAAEEFLIAVTSELACKGTCFIPERQECRNDIIMLKGFEAKSPIISRGMVDEHRGVFITSNWGAVSKCDVNVYNVQVVWTHLINQFAVWCFGNCCVRAKWYWKFTSIDEMAVLGGVNDMAIVTETTTPCDAMELLWCPQWFRVGPVWMIGGTNWRKRSSGVV
jgi:hypothetical protein